jgi:hypothetical protein
VKVTTGRQYNVKCREPKLLWVDLVEFYYPKKKWIPNQWHLFTKELFKLYSCWIWIMGSNTTNGTVPPEFPSQVCQVHHSTMHSRKMLMAPLHSTTCLLDTYNMVPQIIIWIYMTDWLINRRMEYLLIGCSLAFHSKTDGFSNWIIEFPVSS